MKVADGRISTMDTRSRLKLLLNNMGYELHRFDTVNSPLARRLTLMQYYNIDLIFDVGAHTGGYASAMFAHGYRGRIVSFEPMRSVFEELRKRASRRDNWDVVNVGLGNRKGSATIHVADNPECSSLLDLAPDIAKLAPRARLVGSEEVEIDTLDSIFDSYCSEHDTPFLKVDVQGFERYVLEGARQSISRIQGIQLELSLIPHYDGESLIEEMIDYLRGLGYTLMSLEPVNTHNESGQLLQVDGVFFRSLG